MKYFAILAVLFLAVNAEDYCYSDAVNACEPTKEDIQTLPHCNAKYGGIDKVLSDLQKYANTHITRSMEYLLMSTHFSNYEKNREGFSKLFRKFSDETWEDAIDIIKYIGKRGGRHDFAQRFNSVPTDNDKNFYEAYELQAMSKAVDIQKQLAKDAFDIHESVTRRHTHDPEIANYLEEEFAEKHATQIRSLVGHVTDLTKMLKDADNSLSLYLFDEYLQKA